jgi:hypothetical protein
VAVHGVVVLLVGVGEVGHVIDAALVEPFHNVGRRKGCLSTQPRSRQAHRQCCQTPFGTTSISGVPPTVPSRCGSNVRSPGQGDDTQIPYRRSLLLIRCKSVKHTYNSRHGLLPDTVGPRNRGSRVLGTIHFNQSITSMLVDAERLVQLRNPEHNVNASDSKCSSKKWRWLDLCCKNGIAKELVPRISKCCMEYM